MMIDRAKAYWSQEELLAMKAAAKRSSKRTGGGLFSPHLLQAS